MHVLTLEHAEQLLATLPEEHRAPVRDKAFPVMVDELAKPGQAIIDSLTVGKLGLLGRSLGFIVGAGEELDLIKKAVIYNDPERQQLVAGAPYSADAEEALELMTEQKAHLLHMVIGVVGEAAELGDAIGQHTLSGQDLDRENVLEELGDLLFYIQGIANGVGATLEEVLLRNKIKLLGKRYRKGYSDKAAQERADKPAGE